MNLKTSNNAAAKHYQYTKGNYLTREQRDFYEDHGYIIFRNLVDHTLLDECRQRFIDICEKKVDKGSISIVIDQSLLQKNAKGQFLVNKIQHCTYDDVLFKYVSYKPILNIVESIIGPQITALHAMVINKPPEAHKDFSRHPLHQDMHYFPLRPFNGLVASWTAMEHTDEKNGCLFVVPGSHKGELYEHDYPSNIKNTSYHEVVGFENVPKVNLIMEKGDTVFFHPILLHGSGPNFTTGFRKAISCHYINSDCHFIDARNTVQKNIMHELAELTARKYGMSVSFKDILQLSSRVIRGQPGNFHKVDSHL